MTVAAVDRLVHHSTIFELNVESYCRRAAATGRSAMTSHSQLTVETRNDASDSSMAPPSALTGAQRQRAYRLRRKRAAIDAIGEEALASRVTLLALLSDGPAALDANCTSTMLIEIKSLTANPSIEPRQPHAASTSPNDALLSS